MSAVDIGLLVIRVGVGIAFVLHGYPKIAGGPDMWRGLGGAMGYIGIDFAPVFWGFMAAFAEFFGGILLVFGLFTRIVAILLVITMIVATLKLNAGDASFGAVLHPAKMAVVFLGLLISGPGKASVQLVIPALRKRWYG
ncbi:MAG: DoxX family protein [Candidatus Pacebacteria bacterium]|nr:DoxX family protein [Candidatus Paceibacterota bacterium]